MSEWAGRNGAVQGLRSALRSALALMVVALLSACVTVAQAPASSSGAIAWQKGDSHNYEPQSPGLGSSQRYTAREAWIDVYVYDLRRKDWKEGTSDAQFAQHFDSTVDEVRQFAQLGRYGNLKIAPQRETEVMGQRFRTVGYQYVLNSGQAVRSATYLTVRNGRLLKYRVSVYASTGLDADAVAREFVENHLRNDPTAIRA